MVIQIDSREKAHAIQKILAEFDKKGVKHYVSKLYVGDYMSLDNPRVVIDRKQNLGEVAGNVCQEHKRFTDELKRAEEAGIKVIILVEHSYDIKCLEDVVWWNNPRLKTSPKAIDGVRLYKIMKTIRDKYHCEWQFCSKQQTGKRILELLNNDKARNIGKSDDEASSD